MVSKYAFVNASENPVEMIFLLIFYDKTKCIDDILQAYYSESGIYKKFFYGLFWSGIVPSQT